MHFNVYQILARKTAQYKEEIVYPALGLNGEAGEVAEKVKKMLRDDDGVLSEERRKALILELGDVLWYIANMAYDIDVSFEEIAQKNIEKLSSRKKRNLINGDGDNR